MAPEKLCIKIALNPYLKINKHNQTKLIIELLLIIKKQCIFTDKYRPTNSATDVAHFDLRFGLFHVPRA